MHAHAERDEWLMAQVALGSGEPLELLVRRYAQPLVSFLTRMVRDRHRGEELFQEVFLAVWRKRKQYQFPRPFKPWLYAIAVNKGRAAFRAARPELPLDGRRAAGRQPATRRPTWPSPPRRPPGSPRPSAGCRRSSGPSSRCASGTGCRTPRSPRSSAAPRPPSARTCTTGCARCGEALGESTWI